MAEPSDEQIVDTMAKMGGSFVKALADCWRRGDGHNKAKLKAAFPEYWRDYRAKTVHERGVGSEGSGA
jgi:hypothetical protein